MRHAIRVRGTPASGGQVSGPMFKVDEITLERGEASPAGIGAAAEAVACRLEKLAGEQRAASPQGAAILEAQAMMARDPGLIASATALAVAGSPATTAIAESVEAAAALLEAIDDTYVQERAADVREVGRMIARELAGVPACRLAELRVPAIVVAHELTPADTLSTDRRLLLGIVTEVGGHDAHAAIVAREMGIPAVVAALGALASAAGFPAATVDGDTGEVTFTDDLSTHVAAHRTRHLDLSAAPVRLMANVGSAEGARHAREVGALGVGLFRTEFLFMAQSEPVAEDDQFAVYAEACAAMAPDPVVVRTLDAGSDKPLSYLTSVSEPNPALGRRGARLWLAKDELWRPQVRALVRCAARFTNLQVMLPMVAARNEMLLARRRFRQAAEDLEARVPRLGIMVEVPGVAAALDAFVGVADFVSMGTNDLTQYTLAVDREQTWEPYLGELNPGVLRLIASTAVTGGELGMPVGVCGEMAGRPEGAVFLVGARVTSLSMTADALGAVFEGLMRLGADGCRAAAAKALRARTAAAASHVLGEALAKA